MLTLIAGSIMYVCTRAAGLHSLLINLYRCSLCKVNSCDEGGMYASVPLLARPYQLLVTVHGFGRTLSADRKTTKWAV